MQMSGIVVGMDGSAASAQALVWAAREAALHDLQLTAVMAWRGLAQHHVDPNIHFEDDYDQTDAEQALDVFVHEAIGSSMDKDVRTVAVQADPAPGILDLSRDASLLVLGARGLGGFRGLLLGSVSQRILFSPRVPVAIVRSEEPHREGDDERIIAAVDGSEDSHDALRWAISEARVRGAELIVVNAWTFSVVGRPHRTLTYLTDMFAASSEAILDAALLAASDARELPDRVEKVSYLGGAAEVILAQAERADLVVVGTRGRGGLKDVTLGSVSQQVARHSPCPVVVVPRGGLHFGDE